jgi:hypothetical protein
MRPPIESEMDFTTVEGFLGQRTLPSGIARHIRIQLVVSKFISLISHSSNDSVAALALLRLIHGELDTLGNELQPGVPGTARTEFIILDTKLHFNALLVTKLPADNSARDTALKLGLATAFRMIKLAGDPSRMSSNSLRADTVSLLQIQRCLPKEYYTGLIMATMFVITYSYLSHTATREEQALAATHISMSQSIFSACANKPKDEFARITGVLEILARLPAGSSDATKLRFTHRMGVSIQLNAIGMVDEVRGRPTEIEDAHQSKTHDAENSVLDGSYPSNGTSSYTVEEFSSGFEFLRDLWDDPVLNLLDFDGSLQPLGN